MNTTAEPIKKGLFYTPFWLAPEKNTFENRSVRFQELAAAEPGEWRLYLELLAAVCAAQHKVALRHTFPLPEKHSGATVLPEAAAGEVPAAFYDVFQDLLNEVRGNITHTAAAETQRLVALDKPEAEALARRVLTQTGEEADRSAEIWVQAALQIVWTAWAAQLAEDDVPPVEERVHCPCCGTEAVGSVVLIQSDLSGFRYMHCPLCNSRWNALRAKCTSCGDSGGIRIQQVDGASAPELPPVFSGAHAESCEACRTYRKLYRHDKQQYADPVADDLATLGLDIAVGEAGYERGGANPFLLHG